MNRLLSPKSLAVAAVLSLSAGGAQAACNQESIKGTWQIYAMTTADSVISCRLTVGSSGAVGTTTCVYFFGESQIDLTLTGGNVSLSNRPNCAFTGSLNLDGGTNNIKLTLSQDKSMGNGYGSYSGELMMFSLTRVR
jgi:hypothetical protein